MVLSKNFLNVAFFFLLDTGSCYVAQASLELFISRPRPPRCWKLVMHHCAQLALGFISFTRSRSESSGNLLVSELTVSCRAGAAGFSVGHARVCL